MTEQNQRQKNLSLKELQVEQYLKQPGKFYTTKTKSKDYSFSEYIHSSSKQENTFLTQQVRDSSINNDTEPPRSIKNCIRDVKIKTESNSQQNLPRLIQRITKGNLSSVSSNSQFLKRNQLPQISETNPYLLGSFLKNEYLPKKVDIHKQKKVSYDLLMPFCFSLDESGTLEKKVIKNEDYMSNSACSYQNQLFEKSNSSSQWIHDLSQLQSQRNQMDTTEQLKNTSSSKQERIKTEEEQKQEQEEKGIDTNKDEVSVIYIKDKFDKMDTIKADVDDIAIKADDLVIVGEILPQSPSLSPKNQFKKQEQIMKCYGLDEDIHQEKKNTNLQQLEKNDKRVDTQIIKRQKLLLRKNNSEKQLGLSSYLKYLGQDNSMSREQIHFTGANGIRRTQINQEQHMAMLSQILNNLHSGDTNKQREAKEKLKKAAQDIMKVKRFQNQVGQFVGNRRNNVPYQKVQQLTELEKYNKQQLSNDNVIFIKEFFYTISEFLDIISSNKRASLMVQQVRGFNPIIKQILFIDEEIRCDLTLELLEKQILSVMQFYQLKKDMKNQDIKHKVQYRRRGLWFELNQDSIKELQFFYKNLREWVDQKNFDNKIVIQSQFYQDLNEIENIIQKYILNPNSDKVKYKNQCFKDISLGYKESYPFFIQNNIPLQNLKYWEKHLGKFEMISDYVREKDTQISNMCKLYQNL